MAERMTRERPLFSVLIDNYNYGYYLEEAVESVLNQTFPQSDIEIIVVDDGSTDDSSERLKRYKGKVTCIFKENGGQASALNAGIEKARGELIAFLDADDYWRPDKLRLLADEFAKSERVDFVYHFLDVIDDGGKTIDRYTYPAPPQGDEAGSTKYLDRYLKGVLPWFSPTSGMAIRARCLRNVLPIPEEFRIAADLYLHYVLPFYMRELSLIKKPLACYRIHGKNLFGGNLLTVEKVAREINTERLIAKWVERHSQELGYDNTLIHKRLESVVSMYTILKHNLEGKKGKALREAISFDHFLHGDTVLYRISRKAVLLFYAVTSASLYLWLQKRYRKVLYLLEHGPE